jgi:hypothetical protein
VTERSFGADMKARVVLGLPRDEVAEQFV